MEEKFWMDYTVDFRNTFVRFGRECYDYPKIHACDYGTQNNAEIIMIYVWKRSYIPLGKTYEKLLSLAKPYDVFFRVPGEPGSVNINNWEKSALAVLAVLAAPTLNRFSGFLDN